MWHWSFQQKDKIDEFNVITYKFLYVVYICMGHV